MSSQQISKEEDIGLHWEDGLIVSFQKLKWNPIRKIKKQISLEYTTEKLPSDEIENLLIEWMLHYIFQMLHTSNTLLEFSRNSSCMKK